MKRLMVLARLVDDVSKLVSVLALVVCVAFLSRASTIQASPSPRTPPK